MSLLEIFLFIVSLGFLFFSGGLMVNSLTWMGRYLKMSEYTLSFILVAFATSLPELFIGINAALRGVSELSLGNIIGANVLDVTLVIGLAALVAGKLTVDHVVTKEDIQITFGAVMFPLFLLLDGTLSRADGALLLFVFGGYVIYLINQEHKTAVVNRMLIQKIGFGNFLKKFAFFVLGSVMLLASSWFLVSQSIALAHAYSLPLYLIGIILAFGTTLPENIFGVRSILLRHGAMSVGTAMGSVVVNISLILGLVSVINPISVPAEDKILGGMLLTAALITFISFATIINGKLGRKIGIFLLVVAAVFIYISGL